MGDMADRAHPAVIPLQKKWPAAAASVGALLLGGYLTYRPVVAWYEHSQRCHELEKAGDIEAELGTLRDYYFNDSARDDWSPLAAGKYRILVSGDCSFSAECDVQEYEGGWNRDDNPRFEHIACRGRGLSLNTTEDHVIGFNVWSAPSTIVVRLLKNGQPFYEGVPGADCPDDGFCVVAQLPTTAERAVDQNAR